MASQLEADDVYTGWYAHVPCTRSYDHAPSIDARCGTAVAKHSCMTEHQLDTNVLTHRLEPFSTMVDCHLAEGTPDIRGWEVTSPTSVHLGIVNDLLVDLASLRVRYLDIVLDTSTQPARVLLPIGKVWINDALDEIVVPASPSLETLPAYTPERFDREFEHSLLTAFGDAIKADFYSGSTFEVPGAHVADVTCARRATDADATPCPIDEAAVDETEAANGIELTVVPAVAH